MIREVLKLSAQSAVTGLNWNKEILNKLETAEYKVVGTQERTFKTDWNDAEFEEAVKLILDNGLLKDGQRYLHYDGFMYWPDSTDAGKAEAINRVFCIKPCSLDDFSHLKKDAERADLRFCKNTIFFGYYFNEEIIGFIGILLTANKAIIKDIYVVPEYRGHGIFKAMFKFAILFIKSEGIKVVEATCTYMSLRWFLKNGFKITKKYKRFTAVRNENIFE